MSADTGGHLGLNLERNVGHCVRCDWGTKNLREWLLKNGVDPGQFITISDFSLGIFDSFVQKKQLAEYRTQALDLPRNTVQLDPQDWESDDPYAGSLIKKRLTYDEVQYWPLGACRSGYFEGYVIFPFIEDNTVVYWQGRAINPEAKLRKLNPRKQDCSLGKSHWLYGYPFAQREHHLYLVEGTLDQISLQNWLWKNKGLDHTALAINGTSLSFPHEDQHPLNSQFGQIVALKPSSLTFMFDADAYHKAEGLAQVCSMAGISSKAGRLVGKDPNDTDHQDLSAAVSANGFEWMQLALQRARY
jgi:hypothetical protein